MKTALIFGLLCLALIGCESKLNNENKKQDIEFFKTNFVTNNAKAMIANEIIFDFKQKFLNSIHLQKDEINIQFYDVIEDISIDESLEIQTSKMIKILKGSEDTIINIKQIDQDFKQNFLNNLIIKCNQKSSISMSLTPDLCLSKVDGYKDSLYSNKNIFLTICYAYISESKDVALVYIMSQANSTSSGEILLIEKDFNDWRISKRITMWLS